jgi:DNA-binding transcriptional MerR regulator
MLSMKIEKATVKLVATEIRKMSLRSKTAGVSLKEIDEVLEIVSELGEQKFLYWGYDHEYSWFENFALKCNETMNKYIDAENEKLRREIQEVMDSLELEKLIEGVGFILTEDQLDEISNLTLAETREYLTEITRKFRTDCGCANCNEKLHNELRLDPDFGKDEL